MPAHITIITPIKGSCTDRCRQYLSDHAEPSSTPAGPRCTSRFPFDLIPTLHFCSFIVLEADEDFDASFAFEATFDGTRENFVADLLRVAPKGMHELYSHCVGYPTSGLAISQIASEYLIRHDAGSNVFFCGSPGRSVTQIKGEEKIRKAIVQHFCRLRNVGGVAPRLKGLFDVLRSFIRDKVSHRWAEQPAPVPWEVRFRTTIVVVAGFLSLAMACGLGFVLAASIGWSPLSLYDLIVHLLEKGHQFGAAITAHLAQIFPWTAKFFAAFQPAAPLLALSAIWLALHVAHVLFSSITKHPRKQLFFKRLLLHVAVIFKYGTLVFLAGATLWALISELEKSRPSADTSALANFVLLFGVISALLVLQHRATARKIVVELNSIRSPT